MADRTFGWEYPPGVSGNEPQIRGVDPDEACAQCGDPFDYDEPIKLCADLYVCNATCEARYIVRNAGEFDPRQVLDAAGDLEGEDDVVVRLIRVGRLGTVEGRVVGRRGTICTPVAYRLADEQDAEREVLLRDVRAVRVVADGG